MVRSERLNKYLNELIARVGVMRAAEDAGISYETLRRLRRAPHSFVHERTARGIVLALRESRLRSRLGPRQTHDYERRTS